ncbi:MAG: hypothetical protein IT190_05985 [Microbacteriaceae bacterium]|nr:hypothetical protein [Microbacteriaceae bacterium]
MTEATEDGLLLTEYASRMAVKNRFITKILADKQPWFIEQSRDDARATLEMLARESDTEAQSLTALVAKLRGGPHNHKNAGGYGLDDIANIEHRKDVSLEIATRLRKQSIDEEYITDLVDKARRDAWREIASNIEHKLDNEYFSIDEDYERNRDARLRAFIDEDLADLLADAKSTTAATAPDTAP